MAAAACAAAAAVQRAQILMQAKNKGVGSQDSSNGESRRHSPLGNSTTEGDCEESVGDSATSQKDLSSRTKTENDLSGNVGSTEATRSASCDGLASDPEGGGNQDSSLVESLSKEQQVSVSASENQPNSSDFSNVLKEIIQGKLALAAVATVASRHSNQDMDLASRDFGPAARHNNNDLKEQKPDLSNPGAAALMSQILKMRQEMALNMSLQHQQQKLETERERSTSPNR